MKPAVIAPLAALLALIAAVLFLELPEIRRYLKVRSM
jgi:hypothetical protein